MILQRTIEKWFSVGLNISPRLMNLSNRAIFFQRWSITPPIPQQEHTLYYTTCKVIEK